jgi:hypothetical protein
MGGRRGGGKGGRGVRGKGRRGGRGKDRRGGRGKGGRGSRGKDGWAQREDRWLSNGSLSLIRWKLISRVKRGESFGVRRGFGRDLAGFETGLDTNRPCAGE